MDCPGDVGGEVCVWREVSWQRRLDALWGVRAGWSVRGERRQANAGGREDSRLGLEGFDEALARG